MAMAGRRLNSAGLGVCRGARFAKLVERCSSDGGEDQGAEEALSGQERIVSRASADDWHSIFSPQVTLEVDVGRRVAWRVFPAGVVADRTLTVRVCTEDLVRRHGVCGCGAALRAGDGGVTLAGSFVGWNQSVCLRPENALAFDPVRVMYTGVTRQS